MIVGMDFDGVLNDVSNSDEEDFGEELPGAKDAIQKLIDQDFEIIVYTARDDTDEVEKWLEEKGFPPLDVTNQKFPADIYIDDRGYKFEKWNEKTISDIIAQTKQNAEKRSVSTAVKEVAGFSGYKRNFFERQAGRGFKKEDDK